MTLTYLTTDEVIALHIDVLRRMGVASPGLRDRGLLESAVMRPRFLAHYVAGADLVAQAATLAAGISRAQAFVDGNKRTAYFVARIFLLRNGAQLVGDPMELARTLEAAADPLLSNEDADTLVATWLRENTVPLP